MKTHLISSALLLGALATVAGCADAPSTPAVSDERGTPEAAKADQWGPKDDPALFSDDLEYRLDALPREGEATTIPWAGNYWPTSSDGLNFPWEGPGTDSPAKKYGDAFGIEGLEDIVSAEYGVDANTSRTACTKDADCNDKIGEACAKRTGADSGYCIPTWWGICHAWAPAAIMEPEPVHPVTRNGVTFKVNDIKALVSMVYDGATSKFLSLRCDADEQAGEISYDEYGNPTGEDIACKDTNPGTFHVVVANYLGLKGQSFIEDKTFDDEVWNQPLRSFRVKETSELSAQDANELLNVPSTLGAGGREETLSGTVEKDAWHHVETITLAANAKLEVTLTGTGDGDLYLKVGARPDAESYDCRPYEGGTTAETCKLEPTGAEREVFVSVNGYEKTDFELALRIVGEGGGIPTEYVFNSEAEKFVYVRTELDYITESSASTDGNLAAEIDRYTKTNSYEYILELDGEGRITGGEWVGASKKNHPDFFWLPTGRDGSLIARGKISYALVKSLLDESIAGQPTGIETVSVSESGRVTTGAWKHFGPYEATSGAVEVIVTGTGDADLYVRKGAKPTKSSFDCRPYMNGSAESCTLEGPGEFYVSVNGYATSDFDLSVIYRKATGEAPTTEPEPEPTPHLSESGHVAEDQLIDFALPVVAGRKIVFRTQAAGDVDLYVRMHEAPTTATFDRRVWTESGNETLSFTPTVDGTLHVAVHGYEASDFTLTSADQ